MKNYNNIGLVEKLKSVFKLRESPIAFFYTDNPPEEVYRPKKSISLKSIPCIIQLLDDVRQGKTLVLGKQSRNLCPGGLTYLGYKKLISGLEYYLSTGITRPNSEEIALEGERIVKSPQIAKDLYNIIPFKKNPAKYAVFMPLDLVDPEIYTPLLVIFFVKMDQLAGLTQLANFDTSNRTILGISSGCGTIVTEPLAELEKNEVSRPVIGMLTDVIARGHIKPHNASFTIGYDRLIQIIQNIGESFLTLDPWKIIHDRIL